MTDTTLPTLRDTTRGRVTYFFFDKEKRGNKLSSELTVIVARAISTERNLLFVIRHKMEQRERTILSRTWDVIVGIFIIGAGIPVQLIVAALINMGIFGVLAACGVITSAADRWAIPSVVTIWLMFSALAWRGWYTHGHRGSITSRYALFFYLVPRAVSRIITGSEASPRTGAE